MSILTKADFVGKYQIPLTGINDAVLTSIIADAEKRYCIYLFGADLYKYIVDNTTVDAVAFLIAGGYYKSNLGLDDEYCNVYLAGLKEMLLCLIWSEYIIKTQSQVKPVGMTNASVENGSMAPNAELSVIAQSMFNDGVRLSMDVIGFIYAMNLDTEVLSYSDNIATVGYSKFFAAGNVVTINGVENTVVSKTDTTITFENNLTGNSDIEYLFFRNVQIEPIKTMSLW